MKSDYDLFVVGTGVAGAAAAKKCAVAGLKTAISDMQVYGGTCALRGCNPKKILSAAAETVSRSQALKGKGLGKEIGFDWRPLIEYKNELITSIPGKTEDGFQRAGIDMFHHHCRFLDRNTLSCGDRKISAGRIVLACGNRPRFLNIPGEKHLLTSTEFLNLPELPKRIVFVGGGYISFEFANIAARAGSQCTIIESTLNPLRHFDPDLVGILTRASEEEGIEIVTGMSVTRIEKTGKAVTVATENGTELETDIVVHGAGRVPRLDELDLKAAGVEVKEGMVVVDEFLRSRSNPAVYVAGDANGKSTPLTPVALMEGLSVAENILGRGGKPEYSIIPKVVFSEPKLAGVGLSEEQARQTKLKFRVNFQDTSSWSAERRLGLKAAGFKTIIDEKGEKLLGAHILGHNADEVINVFSLAIKYELGSEELKKAPWVFPSVSYNIRYMVH